MNINNKQYKDFKNNEIEKTLKVIENIENSVKINLIETDGELTFQDINIQEFDEEVEQSLYDYSYPLFDDRKDYEYFLNEVIDYDYSDLNEEDYLYTNQETFVDELINFGFGFNYRVALVNEEYYAIFMDNESNGKVTYTNSKNDFLTHLNQLMDNYWLEVLDTLREQNQKEKDFLFEK